MLYTFTKLLSESFLLDGLACLADGRWVQLFLKPVVDGQHVPLEVKELFQINSEFTVFTAIWMKINVLIIIFFLAVLSQNIGLFIILYQLFFRFYTHFLCFQMLIYSLETG